MLALLAGNYFWLGIEQDVETYVRTCLMCQQDKVEHRSPQDMFEPLLPPEEP